MGEYERSITIEGQANRIEDFISDVKNLPKYLPTTKKAQAEKGERVRVQGEANGQKYDSDGYLRMDQSQHRMEWGSDGEEKYSGWLQVTDLDKKQVELTVHLSFDPAPKVEKNLAKSTGDPDDTIEQGLENALVSIKNIIEGKGGKVENPPA